MRLHHLGRATWIDLYQGGIESESPSRYGFRFQLLVVGDFEFTARLISKINDYDTNL